METGKITCVHCGKTTCTVCLAGRLNTIELTDIIGDLCHHFWTKYNKGPEDVIILSNPNSIVMIEIKKR